MKPRYSLSLIAIALCSLFSCSKKSSPTPDPNSITINGTVYPTVTIGNQVWTTVNYSGTGGYHSATYNQYGDYYTRTQALAISLPSGWHVPSIADYEVLISYFSQAKDLDGLAFASGNAAAKLASTSNWPDVQGQGTNTSGFNAQPAGYFMSINSQEGYTNVDALFVTADTIAPAGVKIGRYGVLVNPADVSIEGYSYAPSTYSYSLRFVRNK